MSAHGHATPGDAAASHDHHFEGIPADRPAPDEPRTPLWLPLVGMGLLPVCAACLRDDAAARKDGSRAREGGRTAFTRRCCACCARCVRAESARAASASGYAVHVSARCSAARHRRRQPPGAATGGAAPRPMRSAPVRAASRHQVLLRPNPGGAAPAPRPRARARSVGTRLSRSRVSGSAPSRGRSSAGRAHDWQS